MPELTELTELTIRPRENQSRGDRSRQPSSESARSAWDPLRDETARATERTGNPATNIAQSGSDAPYGTPHQEGSSHSPERTSPYQNNWSDSQETLVDHPLSRRDSQETLVDHQPPGRVRFIRQPRPAGGWARNDAGSRALSRRNHRNLIGGDGSRRSSGWVRNDASSFRCSQQERPLDVIRVQSPGGSIRHIPLDEMPTNPERARGWPVQPPEDGGF